jgi:hypothetical protein
MVRFLFRPGRWRRHIPPKRRMTFNRLDGIISQKTELFLIIALRTLNPTSIYFNFITGVLDRNRGWITEGFPKCSADGNVKELRTRMSLET